jgi:hypothetical protein
MPWKWTTGWLAEETTLLNIQRSTRPRFTHLYGASKHLSTFGGFKIELSTNKGK